MLTLTSEKPYSEDNFESKFQAKTSPFNQNFLQLEEELINYKKEKMEPNKFSSEHIENGVLNITSETPSSEDFLETKLQDKFNKSDQNFEQPEEELIDFMEQQHQELKQIEK